MLRHFRPHPQDHTAHRPPPHFSTSYMIFSPFSFSILHSLESLHKFSTEKSKCKSNIPSYASHTHCQIEPRNFNRIHGHKPQTYKMKNTSLEKEVFV